MTKVEKKYLRQRGGFCPGCEKTDSVRRLSYSTEFLPGRVRVFHSCTACGVDWWEVYKLSGLEVC